VEKRLIGSIETILAAAETMESMVAVEEGWKGPSVIGPIVAGDSQGGVVERIDVKNAERQAEKVNPYCEGR
jgi:hypothetical protein